MDRDGPQPVLKRPKRVGSRYCLYIEERRRATNLVDPEIGLSLAFLRPNKANKAKLSSVSDCLHSRVSLVWGCKTRLTRLNSWVGMLELRLR